MPRESLQSKRSRACEIEQRLYAVYGEGKPSLNYETPFQLTVAVVLSAQCTDKAVNKVTPVLFNKYPTSEAMSKASPEDIEPIIHSLGFYRAKAKNLVALAKTCETDFGGVIPNDVELLQCLPGVGRKTANCVMCDAFNNPQGIAVDTHVFRISHRLRLAGPSCNTAQKTEDVLLKVFPKDQWGRVNHQLVQFGRDFCRAKNPLCEQCPIADVCPEKNISSASV